MKCPSCKFEIPDDANRCGYCGTLIWKQSDKDNLKKFAMWFFGVWLVIIFLVFIFTQLGL